MSLNSLVFSNNPRYRIARHSLFWILWIIYYTALQIVYWHNKYDFAKNFASSLVEVIISTPLDMIFCYSIIYFLIPRYLYKGHYIKMTLLWILLSITFIVSYEGYVHYLLPPIRQYFGMPHPASTMSLYWTFLYLFYQINMEGGLAAAIKLGKTVFIKQKELDLIKKEKQTIVPYLQEGKMQPVFLINALDRVEQLSISSPTLIPEMMKKIKNLLLNVIYDNNQASVSLEKELASLEEYVELEKTGAPGNLGVRFHVTGNPSGKQISPFILLPIVENGFRQLACLNLSEKLINLEIRVADGNFRMKLSWNKPNDSSTLTGLDRPSLQSIGNRLNLLYPRSHDLKIIITSGHFMIDLQMDLHGAVNK
ncbi:histidine kinase [Flavitalea flava]